MLIKKVKERLFIAGIPRDNLVRFLKESSDGMRVEGLLLLLRLKGFSSKHVKKTTVHAPLVPKKVERGVKVFSK